MDNSHKYKNAPSNGVYAQNTHMVLAPRIRWFADLPDEALMSANEISALSGRSRTSVWRDVRRGLLPKPTRLGPSAVRWCAADVRTYLHGDGA